MGELIALLHIQDGEPPDIPGRFSLGFMSSLDTHHFPSGFSDQSIAQSGLTGMLTMIADPSRDLAATVLVNGFTGGRTLATELRHKIWAAILADVTADNGTVK